MYRLAECLHPLIFFCSGSSSSSLNFDVCVCDLSLAKWIVPYCLFWFFSLYYYFFPPTFPIRLFLFFLPSIINYHISLFARVVLCFALGRSYITLIPSPSFLYYYSDIRLLLFCELMLIKCSYVKRILGGVLF